MAGGVPGIGKQSTEHCCLQQLRLDRGCSQALPGSCNGSVLQLQSILTVGLS